MVGDTVYEFFVIANILFSKNKLFEHLMYSLEDYSHEL